MIHRHAGIISVALMLYSYSTASAAATRQVEVQHLATELFAKVPEIRAEFVKFYLPLTKEANAMVKKLVDNEFRQMHASDALQVMRFFQKVHRQVNAGINVTKRAEQCFWASVRQELLVLVVYRRFHHDLRWAVDEAPGWSSKWPEGADKQYAENFIGNLQYDAARGLQEILEQERETRACALLVGQLLDAWLRKAHAVVMRRHARVLELESELLLEKITSANACGPYSEFIRSYGTDMRAVGRQLIFYKVKKALLEANSWAIFYGYALASMWYKNYFWNNSRRFIARATFREKKKWIKLAVAALENVHKGTLYFDDIYPAVEDIHAGLSQLLQAKDAAEAKAYIAETVKSYSEAKVVIGMQSGPTSARKMGPPVAKCIPLFERVKFSYFFFRL